VRYSKRDGSPIFFGQRCLMEFAQRPSFGRWGIRCGWHPWDQLNLVVVDEDRGHDRLAAYPRTWTVRTRRGHHLYYRDGRPNGAPWPALDGVHVKRSAVEYVLAPGHTHLEAEAPHEALPGFGVGEPSRITAAALAFAWRELARGATMAGLQPRLVEDAPAADPDAAALSQAIAEGLQPALAPRPPHRDRCACWSCKLWLEQRIDLAP